MLNGLPWKQTKTILPFFEVVPKYCISDSFVGYEGYSISSMGFLPTVDIMVICIKFTIPVHLSSPIPKMLVFTLGNCCLTMSSLPWFMDLTFQVPMQYCSLDFTFITRRIQNWALFLLWPSCCILSGAVRRCPCPSPVAYWTPSDLGDSSFRVIFFCLFIQFMWFSQQVFWGGLPFPPPADHILSQLSTMACLSWVALHSMVHSFTELHKPLCHNKAVIHGRFQTHT